MVGDFLLVNKAVYGFRLPFSELRAPAFAEPRRGEIIVFTPPHEPDQNYVKRVVGAPGDTVTIPFSMAALDLPAPSPPAQAPSPAGVD